MSIWQYRRILYSMPYSIRKEFCKCECIDEAAIDGLNVCDELKCRAKIILRRLCKTVCACP